MNPSKPSSVDMAAIRDSYTRFVDPSDQAYAMDQAAFWSALGELTLAALNDSATPRMRAVAELLVRADCKFNGHPACEEDAT